MMRVVVRVVERVVLLLLVTGRRAVVGVDVWRGLVVESGDLGEWVMEREAVVVDVEAGEDGGVGGVG